MELGVKSWTGRLTFPPALLTTELQIFTSVICDSTLKHKFTFHHMYFVLPQWIYMTFYSFSLCYEQTPRIIFFMDWRKPQLCKISVLMHPGLGTTQEQIICTKWHNPIFETVFPTWGSTAGPCPANLCKELTWGTLMGTAVIVPKVCRKKTFEHSLKQLQSFPRQNLSKPVVPFQLFFSSQLPWLKAL